MSTDRYLIAEAREALGSFAVNGIVKLGQWSRAKLPEILRRWESDGRDLHAYAVVLEAVMAELGITADDGSDEEILPRIRQLKAGDSQDARAVRDLQNLAMQRAVLIAQLQDRITELEAAQPPLLEDVLLEHLDDPDRALKIGRDFPPDEL